jgi:phosphodiesterase/alkaline phosphatase D-like protein
MEKVKLILLLSICLLMVFNVSGQKYGLIIANDVNVREEASSKSTVKGKIVKELTPVTIEDVSIDTETIKTGITEMKDYWYSVKQGEEISGWVFGAYIILFKTADSVKDCISKNLEFRKGHTGKYTCTDNNYFQTYFELELMADGKVKIHSNCVEGDHILDESGEGRYYINTSSSTFNYYGNMTGEFAPDFYSWEEYFTMSEGYKPTKKELDAYIKEKGHYKSRCFVSIPLETLDEKLLPAKK